MMLEKENHSEKKGVKANKIRKNDSHNGIREIRKHANTTIIIASRLGIS